MNKKGKSTGLLLHLTKESSSLWAGMQRLVKEIWVQLTNTISHEYYDTAPFHGFTWCTWRFGSFCTSIFRSMVFIVLTDFCSQEQWLGSSPGPLERQFITPTTKPLWFHYYNHHQLKTVADPAPETCGLYQVHASRCSIQYSYNELTISEIITNNTPLLTPGWKGRNTHVCMQVSEWRR